MAEPTANQSAPEERAGKGLPSKNLHWILGAIATTGAVLIAVTGVGTHHGVSEKTQQAAQQPAQNVNQTPPTQVLLGLLKQQREKAAEKAKAAKEHAPQQRQAKEGPGAGAPFGKVFSAQSVQGRNRQAQIAASAIVALRGNGTGGNGGSGAALEANTTSAAGTQPTGVGSPQNSRSDSAEQGPYPPVTGVGPGVLQAVASEVRGRRRRSTQAGAQEQWLAARQGRSNGYGDIARVLPSLHGAVLYPGTSLSAVLVTRIDTQTPGMVVAQVTRNVYASDGVEVFPAGSRIIGRYDSQVFDGQYRVMMAFDRVIFPSGREVTLGGSQAAGLRGTAGIEGSANNHFFKALGASLLVAFLDEGVAATGPQSTTQYPSTGASVTAPSQVGAQVLAQQAQRILEPYTSIQPTITVAAGTPFRILVNRTIVLPQALISAAKSEDGGR